MSDDDRDSGVRQKMPLPSVPIIFDVPKCQCGLVPAEYFPPNHNPACPVYQQYVEFCRVNNLLVFWASLEEKERYQSVIFRNKHWGDAIVHIMPSGDGE